MDGQGEGEATVGNAGVQEELSRLRAALDSLDARARATGGLKAEVEARLSAFGEIVSGLQGEFSKSMELAESERALEGKLRAEVMAELRQSSKNAHEGVQEASRQIAELDSKQRSFESGLATLSEESKSARADADAARGELKGDLGRVERTLGLVREDAEKALSHSLQLQQLLGQLRENREKNDAALREEFGQIESRLMQSLEKTREDASAGANQGISALEERMLRETGELRERAAKAFSEIALQGENARAQEERQKQELGRLDSDLRTALKILADDYVSKSSEFGQKISVELQKQESRLSQLQESAEKASALISKNAEENAAAREALRVQLQARVEENATQVSELLGHAVSGVDEKILAVQQNAQALERQFLQYKDAQGKALQDLANVQDKALQEFAGLQSKTLQELKEAQEKAISISQSGQAAAINAQDQKIEALSASVAQALAGQKSALDAAKSNIESEMGIGFKTLGEETGLRLSRLESLEKLAEEQGAQGEQKRLQLKRELEDELKEGVRALATALGEKSDAQQAQISELEKKNSGTAVAIEETRQTLELHASESAKLHAAIDAARAAIEQRQENEHARALQTKQELEAELKAGFKQFATSAAEKFGADLEKAGLERKKFEENVASGFKTLAEETGTRLSALDSKLGELSQGHSHLAEEFSSENAKHRQSVQQLCAGVDKSLAFISRESEFEQKNHAQMREKIEEELKAGFKQLADAMGQKIKSQEEKIIALEQSGGQIPALIARIDAADAALRSVQEEQLNVIRADEAREMQGTAFASTETEGVLLEGKVSEMQEKILGLEKTVSALQGELDSAASELFKNEREKEEAMHAKLSRQLEKFSATEERLLRLEAALSKAARTSAQGAENETDGMLLELASHVKTMEEQFGKMQQHAEEFEKRSAESETEIGDLQDRLYRQLLKEHKQSLEDIALLKSKLSELEQKIASVNASASATGAAKDAATGAGGDKIAGS